MVDISCTGIFEMNVLIPYILKNIYEIGDLSDEIRKLLSVDASSFFLFAVVGIGCACSFALF